MKFGEKLKKLRKTAGLSQKELAEKCGITARSIISYENGVSYPRNRDVYKTFANVFDVDVNYLLTEDENFILQAADKYGKY